MSNDMGAVTKNPLHIDVVKEGDRNRISFRIWCAICNEPGEFLPTLDWKEIRCAKCMTVLAVREAETLAGIPFWKPEGGA